jgi:hypothetical protein
MEKVALHGRAWETVIEELEYSATTLSRNGQTGRADDLDYILEQIETQRNSGCDEESADLGRYEEKMQETLDSQSV